MTRVDFHYVLSFPPLQYHKNNLDLGKGPARSFDNNTQLLNELSLNITSFAIILGIFMPSWVHMSKGACPLLPLLISVLTSRHLWVIMCQLKCLVMDYIFLGLNRWIFLDNLECRIERAFISAAFQDHGTLLQQLYFLRIAWTMLL